MADRTQNTDGQYAILRLARFPLPDNDFITEVQVTCQPAQSESGKGVYTENIKNTSHTRSENEQSVDVLPNTHYTRYCACISPQFF